MLDNFLEFFSDGPGALPLAALLILAGPAFVLWLNVTVIMAGS